MVIRFQRHMIHKPKPTTRNKRWPKAEHNRLRRGKQIGAASIISSACTQALNRCSGKSKTIVLGKPERCLCILVGRINGSWFPKRGNECPANPAETPETNLQDQPQ